MSNLDKLERSTKEMKEAVEIFEADAKKKYMHLGRETTTQKGYWYLDHDTNTAFYWFLSGLSYGKTC